MFDQGGRLPWPSWPGWPVCPGRCPGRVRRLPEGGAVGDGWGARRAEPGALSFRGACRAGRGSLGGRGLRPEALGKSLVAPERPGGRRPLFSGPAAVADRLLERLEAEGLREPWRVRPRVTEWLEGLFPDVETLDTETLQRWMRDEPDELLLDTQTPAEFDVSHLPGALLVPPLEDGVPLPEAVEAWLRQECEGRCRQIVCYCTVGYRSSLMTRLLGASLSHRAAGPSPTASSKIYNLCGGLVKWATERRPMVDQQGTPTGVVHPFSPTWAKLLEPEFRAPAPRGANSSPLAGQHS